MYMMEIKIHVHLCEFNLEMKKESDFMTYKHLNNPKAVMKVSKITHTLNLVDILKKTNPIKRDIHGKEQRINRQARLPFYSNI